VDALNMVLVAVLVFLILRQVMPIAAGLAGGLALNSYGVVSRTLQWGMRARATTVALENITGAPAMAVMHARDLLRPRAERSSER